MKLLVELDVDVHEPDPVEHRFLCDVAMFLIAAIDREEARDRDGRDRLGAEPDGPYTVDPSDLTVYRPGTYLEEVRKVADMEIADRIALRDLGDLPPRQRRWFYKHEPVDWSEETP